MADEGEERARRRKDKAAVAEGGADEGAAAPYAIHLAMENLLDKLRLLNYDVEFCAQHELRPLSHYYFALPGNSSEQLHYLACLMSWLLGLMGHKFPAPQQYDDPNEITANIMVQLRQLGLPADFPQSRVRQGYGDEVCMILNTLAQQALKAAKWKWRKYVCCLLFSLCVSWPEERELACRLVSACAFIFLLFVRPVHKTESFDQDEDHEEAQVVTTQDADFEEIVRCAQAKKRLALFFFFFFFLWLAN